MELRLELPEASIIRVSGPLRVTVASGLVMVLGAVYGSGESFTIHRFRSYAVKALTDAKLLVYMETGAQIEPAAAGEEVLDQWVYTVDSLILKGCRSFMVIGPTDAGKSSLAALIANRGLERGLVPGVVDADIGQADVGPPGFISAARVRKKILWLRELAAEYMRFVGSITPQRNEKRIVGAAVELAEKLRANNVDLVIVDTDGWLQGYQSLDYKADIARLAGIDSIIAIGIPSEVKPLIDTVFSWTRCGVTYLQSPLVRRTRSRDERRELRSHAYRRYLEKGEVIEIDASLTPIYGSCFFAANPVPGEQKQLIEKLLGVKVLGARESSDTVYIAVSDKDKDSIDSSKINELEKLYGRQVLVLSPESGRGLLASLLDDDYTETPALIENIDYERLKIIVRVYRRPSKTRALIVGNIRLKEDYTEAGRTPRCPI